MEVLHVDPARGDVGGGGRLLRRRPVERAGHVLVLVDDDVAVDVRVDVDVARRGRGRGRRGRSHRRILAGHGRGRTSWPATAKATIAAATTAKAVQSVLVSARPPIERNSPSKPRACIAA